MESRISGIIESTLNILERSKSHGNAFNLLKISGVHNSEVLTHTPILKELLDMDGSHGQKDFFLRSFVESLKLDFEINSRTRVKKEQRYGEYGQLDLIIENDYQIIILENKIFAEDQPKQLYRYFRFCNEYAKKDCTLIYLTLFGNSPSILSLGDIKKVDNKYLTEIHGKILEVDLRTISYQKNIISWLEKIKVKIIDLPNLYAAIDQYINLLRMLTNEIVTVKQELKSMLSEMTSQDLLAIKELSNQFNSSDYRGELLFNLFSYVENKFLETGKFEKSFEYLGINFTPQNCKRWFKQISPNNPSDIRDVVGCILKSTVNPNVKFIFIAATDYMHYGVIIENDEDIILKKIIERFPNWGKRHNWKKIPKSWISHALPNLRDFSGEVFKLLSTNENSYLDNFIEDRLKEIEMIVNIC